MTDRPAQSVNSSHRRRRVQRSGFTLIELMIVVAIIGILAAIAISAYGTWITDARVSEAHSMMSDIKAKQEAYYNTWGQYTSATDNPTDLPTGDKKAWNTAATDWQELGVQSDGPVYFQYETEGFAAGGGTTQAASIGASTARDWFIVTATADMDDNSSTNPTLIIVSSQNKTPIIRNKGQ